MNMNKIRFLLLALLVLMFTFGNHNVIAEEIMCNRWSNTDTGGGEEVCNSKTYKGYKCQWDRAEKGGKRCKKSQILADEVKENITDCKLIKNKEGCDGSIINGYECKWMQGACYNGFNDGTNNTIIADDQDDREEQEDRIEQENSDSMELVSCPEGYVLENNQCIIKKVVGENICSEESVQRVLKLVGYILIIAKVLIPLILIVMGSLDLFHAVVGKDDKTLTKSIKTLMIRVVLGVFVFFIPNLVNWAFDVFYETAGGEDNKQCVTCVLDPGNCN